jgi:hypothetical protein
MGRDADDASLEGTHGHHTLTGLFLAPVASRLFNAAVVLQPMEAPELPSKPGDAAGLVLLATAGS